VIFFIKKYQNHLTINTKKNSNDIYIDLLYTALHLQFEKPYSDNINLLKIH